MTGEQLDIHITLFDTGFSYRVFVDDKVRYEGKFEGDAVDAAAVREALKALYRRSGYNVHTTDLRG